jgi:NADH-quinone oxidoreductase subunit M
VDFIDRHILSLMTFLPLLGGAIILCLPKGKDSLVKTVAAVASFLPIPLAIKLWVDFDRTVAGVNVANQFQFVEHQLDPVDQRRLLPGADGISMPMLLLTALLSFLAVVGSWGIRTRSRGTWRSSSSWRPA